MRLSAETALDDLIAFDLSQLLGCFQGSFPGPVTLSLELGWVS